MAHRKRSPLDPLLDAPRVREAARALVEAVTEEAQQRALTPRQYERAQRRIERPVPCGVGGLPAPHGRADQRPLP